MKLTTLNCKLEKATANSKNKHTSRSTDLIKYNKKDAKLIATDGRILAAIHVENDGDNGDDKFITTANFAASRKKENLNDGKIEFNIDGDTCDMASGVILPNSEANNHEREFPKYEMLFTKETPEVVIHLNPKLLVNLIEALGAINTQDKTPTITLKVFGDSKPMHIEYKENKGVIMPCAKPYRKD